MFYVYHRIVPEFLTPTVPVNFPEGFERVAIVLTNDIEEAFKLTNHIDKEWWENPESLCFKESRSTSVGDVLVSQDDKRYLCESIGWKTF